MVRRQEILRRSQADAFEEQIKTLKREREEAQHKLQEAEAGQTYFSGLLISFLHA